MTRNQKPKHESTSVCSPNWDDDWVHLAHAPTRIPGCLDDPIVQGLLERLRRVEGVLWARLLKTDGSVRVAFDDPKPVISLIEASLQIDDLDHRYLVDQHIYLG